MADGRGRVGSALIAVVFAMAACTSYGEGDIGAPALDAGVETGASTSSGTSPVDGGTSAEGGEASCTGKDCPCIRSADCVDPIFRACEKGVCRECSLSPDDCPANEYCLAATLTCVPGCKGDAACATGMDRKCDLTRHRCVECLGKLDCHDGRTCTASGACAAQGCTASPSACTAGQLCCNDVCVNKLNDPSNCNSCGTVCPGGVNAQCCQGTCRDTGTDSKNCGACGRTCNTTQATASSCSNSSCTEVDPTLRTTEGGG